jgi:hypothetical protein
LSDGTEAQQAAAAASEGHGHPWQAGRLMANYIERLEDDCERYEAALEAIMHLTTEDAIRQLADSALRSAWPGKLREGREAEAGQ